MIALNAVQDGLGLGKPPLSGPIFDASAIEMNRRMRVNPLRQHTPEGLSSALDQFNLGHLRPAAQLWAAMWERDDTLSFVKPQLEEAIAGKPWGVFKVKNADPVESARHAAALEYCYANLTAVDAYDRNVRGKLNLLLRQMGAAFSFRYQMHHFVWRPSGGKMIEVKDATPVPAITAEMEAVPLWFFENLTGTLRFLPLDGYGYEGQPLNWDGEWMCTTGRGAMFAASISLTFKRLGFQDWTNFNERYASPKVVGMTNAKKGSEPGKAMEQIVRTFNGDMGVTLYEVTDTTKPPLALLGPEGTASVEIFERFIDRQDKKLTVMYRGSAQANVASKDNETGITAQIQETEALELAHCHNIAGACQHYIDRQVIKFCFGRDVEPLAYFGLPDMDREDAKQLRENAGFLADRGVLVEADTIAERLGVTVTEHEEDALQSAAVKAKPDAAPDGKEAAVNARRLARLQDLVEEAVATNSFDPEELRDDHGRWAAQILGIAATRPMEHRHMGTSRQKVYLQPVFEAAHAAGLVKDRAEFNARIVAEMRKGNLDLSRQDFPPHSATPLAEPSEIGAGTEVYHFIVDEEDGNRAGQLPPVERKRQGEEAMRAAIAGKRDVLNAMTHPDIGAVDFRYGQSGDPANKYKGGSGVSHIVAKHGEATAGKVPEIIAYGAVVKQGTAKVDIEYDNHRVSLANNLNGEPTNRWVLTAFEKGTGNR